MIRHRRPLLVASIVAASAAALSGCATFDNNDVVARVGDAEFTEADLRGLADPADSGAEFASIGSVRVVINNWIVDRILRADLASSGTPLDEVEGDLTNGTLAQSVQVAFQTWSGAAPTVTDTGRIQGIYDLGPAEAGVICVAHILVETEEVANTVVDKLGAGADFADLATEYSFDPGSASDGGKLPCTNVPDFANTYVFEFASAALDANVGDIIGPVESQFGYHIIWLRPFADLGDAELAQLASDPQVRFTLAVESNDVWVNPRFGEFNGALGLQPVA